MKEREIESYELKDTGAPSLELSNDSSVDSSTLDEDGPGSLENNGKFSWLAKAEEWLSKHKHVFPIFPVIISIISIFMSFKALYFPIVKDQADNKRNAERHLMKAWQVLGRGAYGREILEFEDDEKKLGEALLEIDFAAGYAISERTYFLRGSFYFASGEYANALECFEDSIGLKPGYFEAFNAMGDCHQAMGNDGLAQKAYSKATELKHNFSTAHYNMGILAVKRGDYISAEAYFKKSSGRYRNNSRANYQLEILQEKVSQKYGKQDRKKKKDYLRSISRYKNPANADDRQDYVLKVYYLGNLFLEEEGEKTLPFNVIIFHINRAIVVAPENEILYYQRACVFMEMGDLQRAKFSYIKFLDKSKNYHSRSVWYKESKERIRDIENAGF